MDITYSTNKVDLADLKVTGFFEDWPDKPNENILRRSIENADYIVLAIDTKKKKLAGLYNRTLRRRPCGVHTLSRSREDL